MLEKITLKNFQGHARLSVPLVPGLTALVGASRAGKSSVLRALRWACQGGPATGFLRHGGDSVKASLHIDGVTLVRERGKGTNGCRLGGKAFAAIGTGVPEEVSAFLSLSDINFQGQLDPPFWLSLTPGEAARELNRVVALDLIDSSLSSLSASLRRAASDEESARGRLSRAEARLAEMAWVPHAESALGSLESLESEVEASRASAGRLQSLLDSARDAAESAADVSDIVTAAGRIRTLLKERAILEGGCVRLESLINECREAGEDRCRSLEDLGRAEEALKSSGGACPLCGHRKGARTPSA